MKRYLSLLLAALLFIMPAGGVFAEDAVNPVDQAAQEAYALRQKNISSFNYLMFFTDFVSREYLYGVDRETLLEDILREMIIEDGDTVEECMGVIFKRLDENSYFFNAEEYEAFMRGLQGSFSGIGATINDLEGTVVVIQPIKDSPAHRAGILTGDLIVRINGEDVTSRGIEYVQGLLLGEEGTEVEVGVSRGGADDIIYFKLTRAVIDNSPIEHSVLDDNIGYVRFLHFTAGISDKFSAILDEMDAKGVKKLIIDVRNNPGGYLDEALSMCAMLVPNGLIASSEFMNSARNQVYESQLEEARYEIAVLANGGSASASELFSAAIKERGVGKIIGTTTFGKGTIQQIFPTYNNTAVKLTMGQYVTAGGNRIHKIGVEPDFKVSNSYTYFDSSIFERIDFYSELKQGDSGKGVLAVEQRLKQLGFLDSADEAFEADTTEALKIFQASQGLEVTGVVDPYSRIRINDIDYDVAYEIDHQYDAAIEYLKNGVIEE